MRLLGLWCACLSVAFVWPQVARVYRQRTVEGVAPNGTLHVAVAAALWTIYGLARADLAVSAANAAVVVAMALIAAQQIRYGTLPARTAGLTAVVTVIVGSCALAISPDLVGWLAIGAGATSALPQTFHVLRSSSLDGVSVPTYALLCLTASSWAAYGFGIGDPLIVVTNLVVLPCAVVVLARTLLSRRGAAIATV
jgi:uncharacterized protein with PQ loop repeat